MVDRHRGDSPGAWHHVMNRGVARRMVIENERDAEEFRACLLRVVEGGLIEIHAYCLMGTHFHMLVRSPKGELARAMMLMQNRYARWFNRGRRRDGPLWRGRFLSKLVCSEAYWHTLVRYIDHNPVKAGIVLCPDAYRLGSAWHYARKSGPPWLTRAEVEQTVREELRNAVYDPADYCSVFGDPLSRSGQWMLERNGFSHADVEGSFVDLVGAAPDRVRAWMRRKARLADGDPMVGAGVIDPDVLIAVVTEHQLEDPDWSVRPGRRAKPGWRALTCALLHQVSGCTIDEIATRVGVGASTVWRHLHQHPGLLLGDPQYERRCEEGLSRVMAAEYGGDGAVSV
ncbi:MAG: REP element-mobilizing transposase RayT [Chlamydiales bacterium]|jgi:REP element-mobilizing transposase RayT